MSNFTSPPRLGLETKQGSCFPPACLCSPSQQRSMGTPKTGWERDTPALHTGDGSLGKQTPAYQFAQRCRQKPRADKHWLWMKKTLEKRRRTKIGQTNKQDLPFDKGSLARPDTALPRSDIRLMWWITWQAKQRLLMEAGETEVTRGQTPATPGQDMRRRFSQDRYKTNLRNTQLRWCSHSSSTNTPTQRDLIMVNKGDVA